MMRPASKPMSDWILVMLALLLPQVNARYLVRFALVVASRIVVAVNSRPTRSGQ